MATGAFHLFMDGKVYVVFGGPDPIEMKPCAQCWTFAAGPWPIIRGHQGQTVIVCAGCKAAHVAERDTADVTRDTRENAEVLGG